MDLRKLFPSLTGIVILLLAAIAILGGKQYLLYRHCELILDRSNEIIFQFNSIREHVNDSLITGKAIDIQVTGKELLGFDQELKGIIDDVLIPEEFKLSFISEVDLMGLVVQLRAIRDNVLQSSAEQRLRLSTSLRSISNRLHGFHKLLAGYTRSLLLNLYKVIVGTLALVIFFTTTMLLLINRFIAVPIVRLCSLAGSPAENDPVKPWRAGTLSFSIEALTSHFLREQAYKKRFENLQICLDNTLQTLPDSFTTRDDWETVCAALQTNPDYLLVWVGQSTGRERFPTPVTGCGCVSSSPKQCKEAIEHLIEFCHQEKGLCDTARKALQQGIQKTGRISPEHIPQSLRNSLAFGKDPIISASFPLSDYQQTVDTVITIYSTEAESFGYLESRVLLLLCRLISHLRVQQEQPLSTAREIQADLYRFSVAGELSGTVAHEMVNRVNGALNYSQALVDLCPDRGADREEHLLLQKLHAEEQKIARLASTFNQLTGPDASIPRQFSAARLVEDAALILQGKLRQNNISLETILDGNLPMVNVAPIPMKIVLFTLLHEAEEYIGSLPEAEKKQEHIRLLATLDKTDPKLLLTISPVHEDVETRGDTNPGPWPPIATCHEMMLSLHGNLSFRRQPDGTSLMATLHIPLQVSQGT